MSFIALTAALIFSVPTYPAGKPYRQVTAKSGAIQLTLRLLDAKPRVKQELYYQIELKNIGQERIYIGDLAFRDLSGLPDNSVLQSGTHLEMRTPSGAKPTNLPGEHRVVEAGVPAKDFVPSADPPVVKLDPGKTALVKCGRTLRRLDTDWCALDFWILTHPGSHRLRAVYDNRPKKGKAEPEEALVRTPWITLEVRK